MAEQTILQETLDNDIVNGDFLIYWKTAAGVQRRVSRASALGATLTGLGTIVTDGYTFTVPATGTAALKTGAPTADNLAAWSDANTVEDSGIAKSAVALLANVAQKTGTPTAGRVVSWADANTVQDGGFALTDVARLSQAQTFAANQRINGQVGVNVAPSSAAQLDVVAGGSTVRGLRVKAAASPTVNMFEVVNSADALMLYVNSVGTTVSRFITAQGSIVSIANGATANVSVTSSRMYFAFFRSTANTNHYAHALVYVRSNGTVVVTSLANSNATLGSSGANVLTITNTSGAAAGYEYSLVEMPLA